MAAALGRRGREDGVRSPDAPLIRWVRAGPHRILHPDHRYVPPEVLRYMAENDGRLPDGWQ